MTSSSQPKSAQPRRRTIAIALVAVVATAIAVVSFLPGQEKRALHSTGRFHSLGHLFAFSVVGYVAAWAASSRRARIIAFCAAVLFGVAIEVGEHLTFGSALERKDMLVDALGVLAGTLLAHVTTRWQ